jgi:hypothetical protein
MAPQHHRRNCSCRAGAPEHDVSGQARVSSRHREPGNTRASTSVSINRWVSATRSQARFTTPSRLGASDKSQYCGYSVCAPACVQRPICVVVAQVPDLSGFDRLAAAGALEHSGVDHRLQPTPQRLMRRPIPPLRSRKAPGAHRNDVVYTPAGVIVDGHPGARSMGTELVGTVDLENGERGRIESLPKRRLANTPPRRNFSVQLRARSRPRCRAAPPPRRARRDGNAPLASSTRWPAASWPFYMPHPPPRHLSLRDAGSGALSRPPVGHRLRAAVIRTRAVD